MTSPSSPARHQTGTDKLLVDVADAVAVVTLNNPAKRNALSSDMRAALPVLLEALQADDQVRVVVLTGAGDKAFASGADISEFADPQVEHLEMTEPVQHPALGRLDILRNAVRMTDAPATVRTPSPDIGADTDAVLTELGYPREEIDGLRAQGVI